MEYIFSKKEAISFGWEQAKDKLLFLAGLAIIVFGVPSLLSYVGVELRPLTPVTAALFDIASMIVQFILDIGFVYILLKIHDKQEYAYKDLFAKARLFVRYIFATILYFLVVLLGLILLVIPGIVWGIKYSFYLYAILDKGLGAQDALSLSGKITKGSKWNLFFFGLLLGLINIAGAIVLGVGLLVTVPLTALAWTFAYRKLLASYERRSALSGADSSQSQ